MVFGLFLVLLFILFCGALYYLVARQGGRMLACTSALLVCP